MMANKSTISIFCQSIWFSIMDLTIKICSPFCSYFSNKRLVFSFFTFFKYLSELFHSWLFLTSWLMWPWLQTDFDSQYGVYHLLHSQYVELFACSEVVLY